ncbi:MAG: XdhC family protein [Gemmatimonadota bacterium]
MRDVLSEYHRLTASGARVGRAVVTSVWGSAPRPEGACLLATADGQLTGSVSGGCVEAATAQEVALAIESGVPRLVTYGVTDENAWAVGLACGGTIKVFVEPTVRPEIVAAASGPGGVVIATVIEGNGVVGSWAEIRDDGSAKGDLATHAPEIASAALEALRREASRTIELPGTAERPPATVFLEVFPRQPRLVIIGAVHIAAALVPLARQLGWYTIVADGREAFLVRDRFPAADRLLLAWPEEAFEQVGLDPGTFVCVLSHDPKFDDPACIAALKSPARYVGAIGSRKTQRDRRERLKAAGITDEQLTRLHGPVGFDLGGRRPAEIALGILAEMTAVRYGRSAADAWRAK